MKKAIELTKKADIKGVKIKIAGRLAGKEIARAECIKKGRQCGKENGRKCSKSLRCVSHGFLKNHRIQQTR
jgi:ribosomal protein S3